MNNIDTYNQIFIDSLGISLEDLPNLKYQDVASWDSIGHMNLMSEIEDHFSIQLDIDDIIDFSSYAHGKSILSKYNVSL